MKRAHKDGECDDEGEWQLGQVWRRLRAAWACWKRTLSTSALQGWMQSNTCNSPFADVDQNSDHPDASSVDRVDEKAQQAGRIFERCVERLGANRLVLHRTVGQELDERREEDSGVGHFFHERGPRRKTAAHGKSVGHRRRRWWAP